MPSWSFFSYIQCTIIYIVWFCEFLSLYSNNSGIFLEHATANAPGPMWQDTLKDNGFSTISIPGNSASTSFLNVSASSRLCVCHLQIYILSLRIIETMVKVIAHGIDHHFLCLFYRSCLCKRIQLLTLDLKYRF